MSSALKLALGFVLAFAAGFSTGWFLKSGPGAGPMPERPAVDRENQASAAASEDVLRRLLSIETLLGADRGTDGPSQGEATRSETTDLHAYLQQRFDSLEEAVRSLGSVEDLSEIKIDPDLEAIQQLQERLAADQDKALILIGMSYREAIHQFGAPTFTKVHDRVRTPGGGYITHWLWETPSLGSDLAIAFAEGVAYYAWFSPSGTAREYIESLERQ